MKPADRRRKKKFVKTIKHTKRISIDTKSNVHECHYCGRKMHGMPHRCNENQTRKLSKTKRRPEVMFAGTLCNQCRTNVWNESAKVYAGIKPLDEIDLRLKNWVNQALLKTGE